MRYLRVFLVLFLVVSAAYSQQVEDVLRMTSNNSFVSPRAGGMGMSFIGVVDDASAVYYNPAGLFLPKYRELAFGLGMFRTSTECAYFNSLKSANEHSTLPAYVAYASPIKLQNDRAGLSVLYNYDEDYRSGHSFNAFNPNSSIVQSLLNDGGLDSDNALYKIYLAKSLNGQLHSPVIDSLQQSAVFSHEGGRSSLIAGFGIEINKAFGVGLSIGSTWAHFNYSRTYIETDTNNKYNINDTSAAFTTVDLNKLEVSDKLEQDMATFFIRLGFLCTFGDWGRLSLTFTPPLNYNITEHFSRTTSVTFDNNEHFSDEAPGDNHYIIYSPWDFGVGFSANVAELTASVAFEYRDMTSSEFSHEYKYLVDLNDSIRIQFREQIKWGAGFEYNPKFAPIALRAGMESTSSAYSANYFDNSFSTFSFGAGVFLNDHIRLDALARFSSIKGNFNVYGNGSEANYSLTTKPSVFALQFSYKY